MSSVWRERSCPVCEALSLAMLGWFKLQSGRDEYWDGGVQWVGILWCSMGFHENPK